MKLCCYNFQYLEVERRVYHFRANPVTAFIKNRKRVKQGPVLAREASAVQQVLDNDCMIQQ